MEGCIDMYRVEQHDLGPLIDYPVVQYF